MALYLLIIGFISIIGQVVILRELQVAFYGIELIYILAMGIWLFWTAAGALIGKKGDTPSPTALRHLFILFSFLLPVQTVIIRAVRILFRAVPGSYLPFAQQIGAVIIVLFPMGILLGLMFQWASKLYIGKNRGTLATAYAIESAGAIIGGLVSALFLHFGFQNFAISVLCGLLTLLFIAVCHVSSLRYLEISVFVILIGLLSLSWEIDWQTTGWNHPDLLDTQDSPYSRITIENRSDQLVLFENDALSFETESTAAEVFVHLAAIQREAPEKILISGGGAEGIVSEMLKHGPKQADYAELNPVLLDMGKKHLPETYGKSLESEVVRVHHADPRKFLKTSGSYDLMLLGMPDPSSGQSNRFYTREYFRQCADRLEPGGVLALRLRSSENLWTSFLTYRNAGIWLALSAVFRDVVVLPGVSNILIASDTPLTKDPEKLIGRFVRRKMETRLVSPPYIRYLYTNDRFFEIRKQLASADTPPNTDIQPVCYRYSAMIWLSKFIPGMIHQDVSFFSFGGSDRIWAMTVPAGFMTLLILLSRRRRRFRKILTVTLAGFLGMVMETMLILHYQMKNGVLFQNIGILLMVFMGGLAVGAMVIQNLKFEIQNSHESLGRSLFLGFLLICLLFVVLLRSGYSSGIFTVSSLLFLTGFLVSGILAVASLSGVRDQKMVVSPLYAADLLGGCAGALFGTLVLIPFLGMEYTAFIMGIIALSALFI